MFDNLPLSDTGGNACFQKIIKKRKLLIKTVIFGLCICASKSSRSLACNEIYTSLFSEYSIIPCAPALRSFGTISRTTASDTTVSTESQSDLYRCATVGA